MRGECRCAAQHLYIPEIAFTSVKPYFTISNLTGKRNLKRRIVRQKHCLGVVLEGLWI
jgi:hypothetical protein